MGEGAELGLGKQSLLATCAIHYTPFVLPFPPFSPLDDSLYPNS